MAEHRSKPTKITTTRDSAAGQVVHTGGRNVWRWKKTSPDDSTSVLLKRLDNDSLRLEPTARVQRPDAKAEAGRGRREAWSSEERDVQPARDSERAGTKAARGSGGGFDPYNSTR